MSFTSSSFLFFFAIFFLLYWLVFNKKLQNQNLLLLVGSYFFYAWVDWKFLFFLISISILNFFLGIYIEKGKNEKKQRFLLMIGLFQGIGGLLLFKYFNFFVTSVNEFLKKTDIHLSLNTINLIAPLGISFFTFKTISYLIDISKGKIEASKNWIDFFIYVSFFPTILAGPIDKAKMFLPQLRQSRVFDYYQAAEGMRQILWGLFKKSVIADNCASVTSSIFSHYASLPASSLLFGAILYSFEIYADFSGYSDMAIGISRLLGFKVTKNFEYPFFSQNIAEFWRKWHISLTSWLTEYVFTPLSISFRNLGNLGLALAIIINFTIIGIWHGANWTYVLFGFLHGCYYIPLIVKGTMNKKRKIANGKNLPSFNEAIKVFSTFAFVTFTFIIFRSNSVGQAFGYFNRLFSKSIFSRPEDLRLFLSPAIFILIMFLIEWFSRNREFALSSLPVRWSSPFRWSFYIILSILILFFSGNTQQFIYAQF